VSEKKKKAAKKGTFKSPWREVPLKEKRREGEGGLLYGAPNEGKPRWGPDQGQRGRTTEKRSVS